MKLSEAKRLIKTATDGFRVHFETRGGGLLRTEYFPGRDEPMIKTEDGAWKLAREFSKVDPKKYVNIYVVNSEHSPVDGYRDHVENCYPAKK